MKIIHLSDLHLGKRVNSFSLIEDQKYILDQVLDIIDSEKPQAVLIAGDVYDKGVPSTEAVNLFDDFLVRLSKKQLDVFVASGNHDSAERLAFGSRLMIPNIHIAQAYQGAVQPITLQDEQGDINFFMLPFVKPSIVRQWHPENEVTSYQEAVDVAINAMNVDTTKRNVLIAHQFVTGAQRSESEEVNVGGVDNVNVESFNAFNYVALGHLHMPQHVGRETVRYCGSPLKYSFSEANADKTVTIVEIGKEAVVREVPLKPKTDMSEIKGSYDEITARDYYLDKPFRNNYLRITLTDENDIPDAMGRLRTVYPNIMELRYDNKRTRHDQEVEANGKIEEMSPIDIIEQFYELQNNDKLSDEQRAFTEELITTIWGE